MHRRPDGMLPVNIYLLFRHILGQVHRLSPESFQDGMLILEDQYEESQTSIPSFPHSILQLGYHCPWQAIRRTDCG